MKAWVLLLAIFSLSAAVHGETVGDVSPNAYYDKDGTLLPHDPNDPRINWQVLANKNGADEQWKSVGLIESPKPHCSSTLMQPPESATCPDPMKAKAFMLTNGHCVIKQGPFNVKFGVFAGQPGGVQHSTATAKYGSMAGSDIGILQLSESPEFYSKLGIRPRKFAKAFETNKPLTTVGIPIEGVTGPLSLHKGVCMPERKADVVDSGYIWPGALVLGQCSVGGGQSGSALFNDDGDVAGVVNSGIVNQDFGSKNVCQADTCVTGADGQPKRELKNFGMDVTKIAACFKNCLFDTTAEGCPLMDPGHEIGTTVTSSNPNWAKSLNSKIDLSSDGMFDGYKIKGCVGGTACDCSDMSKAGYKAAGKGMSIGGKPPRAGASIRPSDYFPAGTNTEADPHPAPAKFNFLCIQGVLKSGKPDAAKNITRIPIYLYDNPPRKPLF